jgi:hypothetical protein
MKIHELVLAAVGAAVLLGSLVAPSASARVFSSDSQSIRALFSEVIIKEPLGASASCRLTLEGSLHSSTIDKTPGTLIGSITRTTLGQCATGTETILTETLPWNVRYSGFQGRLPEITSVIVHIVGAAIRLRLSNGIICLLRSELSEPAIGRFHFDSSGSHHVRIGLEGAIRTGAECGGIRVAPSTEVASRYVVRSGTSTPVSITLI